MGLEKCREPTYIADNRGGDSKTCGRCVRYTQSHIGFWKEGSKSFLCVCKIWMKTRLLKTTSIKGMSPLITAQQRESERGPSWVTCQEVFNYKTTKWRSLQVQYVATAPLAHSPPDEHWVCANGTLHSDILTTTDTIVPIPCKVPFGDFYDNAVTRTKPPFLSSPPPHHPCRKLFPSTTSTPSALDYVDLE